MLKQSKFVSSNLSEVSKILQQRKLLYEHSHAFSVEEIFEVTDEHVSSIQHWLQMSDGQEKLQIHYGLLGQKYLRVVLSGKKAVNTDNVYGVYFSSDGTMLVTNVSIWTRMMI